MKFACLFAACLLATPALAQTKPHNIIIFVADGLRYGSVTQENMPNMYRLKSEGVDFTNSHSLYPTITTVNASAIATGHYIGDTGDFGNSIYTATPMISSNGSPIAALENDTVLAEMNQKFDGNYLNEDTIIARARAQGFNTAVIGKLGPTRIQDSTAAPDGSQTLILDDNTGHEGGFGLPQWFARQMKTAFVTGAAPGTQVPNIPQEVWLMKATTRIVLPHLAEDGKPFVLLFWSRDPDFSQHNTKDSVGEYEPGINGPSGWAGTRDADTTLGELLAALKAQGLDKTTDVFVTADHGFLTVAHASASSPSARLDPDAPLSDLSSGFLAVDLASALHTRLFDPGKNFASVDFGSGAKLSAVGVGLLGDPQNPDVVVVPNGGTDLIYLPKTDAKETAGDVVKFLTTQDYVAAIFVNDKLGKFPGALSMSDVNLIGSAKTPQPSIYVSFRSFAGGCPGQLQCAVGVHALRHRPGQPWQPVTRGDAKFHGRDEADFKSGYADAAPISNADIAPTLAHIAGLNLPARGKLKGRVIAEALRGGSEPSVARHTMKFEPAENGATTILNYQQVGEARYFDAAGFAGKVVGLTP